MNYYIDKWGNKTSEKLEKIKKEAWHYVHVTKGTWEFKNSTKKMWKFRNRFEKEVERIGGVKYTFSDIIA